jgi:hypothetical protein
MGENALIYTKLGGVPNEEGAPCVERRAHQVVRVGCQVWDEGCHLSHIQKMSNQRFGRRRARHLSILWAATSRVRHLSKRGALPNAHMLKNQITTSSINPQSIGVCPL